MTLPTLVIGDKNRSSWSLRPWLALRVFGVDFEELRLPLDTPEFRARIGEFSPTGKVPALLHDGVVVWESLAILEYVNETFLAGRGWPHERAPRAHARAIAAEMHAGFAALRRELPLNLQRRGPPATPGPEAARDIARVQQLWQETRARFATAGPFLFGDFGLADAMYAPVALRFVAYGTVLTGAAQGYVEAITALPAVIEWRAAAEAERERG